MPDDDGKMRLIDAASAQQLLRLIQSVPSFKNGRLIMTAGTIPQAEYPHKTGEIQVSKLKFS